MALRQNITTNFFTGEDKQLTCTVYQAGTTLDQAEAGTGTPQNITGWALSWMLKKRQTDTDAAAKVTKTTAGGTISMTTPGSGVCEVGISDTDIDALPAGLYWHELKRTDAGSETVLIYGTFVLKQALHRT